MHADTAALRPATVPPDDDVDRTIRLGQEIPETGRTAMTDRRPPVVEHRATLPPRAPAQRKDSRQPAALRRQSIVANGVDAPMQTMQAARIDAASHAALTET